MNCCGFCRATQHCLPESKWRPHFGTNGLIMKWRPWPVYGKQWRRWEAPWVDSSTRSITGQTITLETIRTHATCHIVSALEPGDVNNMALPLPLSFGFMSQMTNCHASFREAPIFSPASFNIASYACLLTLMLAQVCGYQPGEFFTFGMAYLFKRTPSKPCSNSLANRNLPISGLTLK